MTIFFAIFSGISLVATVINFVAAAVFLEKKTNNYILLVAYIAFWVCFGLGVLAVVSGFVSFFIMDSQSVHWAVLPALAVGYVFLGIVYFVPKAFD